MFEKGVHVDIAGKPRRLVFNTYALKEVGKRFGGVQEMAAELDADKFESIDSLCWLVAMLANQGTMIDSGNLNPNNPDLLTADQIAIFTGPKEFEKLSLSVTEAICLGMEMEYKAGDNGPVDVVLEELAEEEKKSPDSPAE